MPSPDTDPADRIERLPPEAPATPARYPVSLDELVATARFPISTHVTVQPEAPAPDWPGAMAGGHAGGGADGDGD